MFNDSWMFISDSIRGFDKSAQNPLFYGSMVDMICDAQRNAEKPVMFWDVAPDLSDVWYGF